MSDELAMRIAIGAVCTFVGATGGLLIGCMLAAGSREDALTEGYMHGLKAARTHGIRPRESGPELSELAESRGQGDPNYHTHVMH